MQTLFHTCGQAVLAGEQFDGQGCAAVFLDLQTDDGLDRCPQCRRALLLRDCKCQAPSQSPKPQSTPDEVAQNKRIRDAHRFIASARKTKRARAA